MYSFGRVSEITRDELKFGKFVTRLRVRFSSIFTQLLEKQLVLKGIMTPEEFVEIKDSLRYDFIQDNYFQELKEAEIAKERLSTLRDVEDHIGTYYSREWVRKNILQMSEDDIRDMDKQIAKEAENEPDDEMEEPEEDANNNPQDSKVVNG
jgi:hypothetical protein